MKILISSHDIQKPAHPELELLVDKLAKSHIARHLSKFSPDAIQLHVRLEKNPHLARYQVKLQLGMPGANLESADESDEITAALHKSFAELERQLERQLAPVRREEGGAP